MDWCEWCVADSCRLNANAACCRARGLAMAPAARRHAVYSHLRATEGEDVVLALHAEVRRFKARRLATAPREVRQRAYYDEVAESSPAGRDLLKQMVLDEYERRKAA